MSTVCHKLLRQIATCELVLMSSNTELSTSEVVGCARSQAKKVPKIKIVAVIEVSVQLNSGRLSSFLISVFIM